MNRLVSALVIAVAACGGNGGGNNPGNDGGGGDSGNIDGADIVTRGFSGDIARWSLPEPEPVIATCDHGSRCGIVTQ